MDKEDGDPNEIRTRMTTLKGLRPLPLDDETIVFGCLFMPEIHQAGLASTQIIRDTSTLLR